MKSGRAKPISKTAPAQGKVVKKQRQTFHTGDIQALNAALSYINKDVSKFNLCARSNFMCCGVCACAKLSGIVKEKKRRGAVFYHRQGHTDDGRVFLHFGSAKHKDDDTKEIGQLVVEELAHYGFDRVEWEDENPGKSIIVHLKREPRQWWAY